MTKPLARSAGAQVRNGTKPDVMRTATDAGVQGMTLTTGRTSKRSGAKTGSVHTKGATNAAIRFQVSGAWA